MNRHAPRCALSLLLLLCGCETRTLQSCMATMVLLGPVQITLQCPPHDAYLHGAPDLPEMPEDRQ